MGGEKVTPERVKAEFCDSCRHSGKGASTCPFVEQALYDDSLLTRSQWVHRINDPPGEYHCQICGYKREANTLLTYCPNCNRHMAAISEEVMS